MSTLVAAPATPSVTETAIVVASEAVDATTIVAVQPVSVSPVQRSWLSWIVTRVGTMYDRFGVWLGLP